MKESLRLIRPFLRGLPIILLSVVLAVIIAKKYLSYVTPQYESTVKIKLADLTKGISNNNLYKDFDVFASSNKIAAEIELIKSNIIIDKALEGLGFETEIYRVGGIRKQKLYQNTPIQIDFIECEAYYDIPLEIQVVNDDKYYLSISGESREITGNFNDTLNLKNGKIVIQKNDSLLNISPNLDLIANYEIIRLSKEKLIQKIKKNIDVISSDKDVPVISIIFRSPLPQKAADFVNKLAKTYIQDYIEAKHIAAKTTVNFLDERIQEMSSYLTKAENNIESYKNQKGIINLRQESETDLRKISQLKIQLSNLKISLDALQELEDNLRNENTDFLLKAPNFQTYTDLLSTELVKKIKALQAEKRDLLLIYTKNDDRVKVIDYKINDLIVYLIEGVTNSKRNQKTKYNELQKEIKDAEEVFFGFATKQKDLNVMTRDFNIFESSYNFLNEKKIEAEIARAAKISFHRIISPAVPSKKPISPNRVVIIIVSGLLALIGTVGLIYIVHIAKGKVHDIFTIESMSSIPIAIKTPFLNTISITKKHFLKEAIQLELKKIIAPKTTICISSNTNQEGRQLHTKELAYALKQQNRKVLILDFQNIIHHEEIDIIDMSDEKYRKMNPKKLDLEIQNMSTKYDITILDNEDIGNERIGLLLMSLANHNLYVVDSRKTPTKHIQEIDLIKHDFDIKNMSFIMNKYLYNPSVIKETLKLVIYLKNYFLKKLNNEK